MNRRPSKSRNSSSFSDGVNGRFRTTDPEAFLAVRPRRRPFFSRLLRALLAFLVLVLAGNALSNRFVRLLRVTVPVTGLSAELDGYTILHLSDLKGAAFGPGQDGIARLLQGQKIDCAVLSGDMVSDRGNAQPLYDLLEAVRRAAPEAPVYFIAGDADPAPLSMEHASGGSPFAPWVLGCRQRGARLLASPVSLREGDQGLWLVASSELSLDLDGQQGRLEQIWLSAKAKGDRNEIELAEYNLGRLNGMRDARRGMKAGDICIAVTHVPPGEPFRSSLRAPSGSPVSLLLAGHYLGGLLRLPFLGPVFLPSASLPLYGLFPGAEASGLAKSGQTQVYVSPGLGAYDAHYPPFFRRLFNPPAISLLTLVPSSL